MRRICGALGAVANWRACDHRAARHIYAEAFGGNSICCLGSRNIGRRHHSGNRRIKSDFGDRRSRSGRTRGYHAGRYSAPSNGGELDSFSVSLLQLLGFASDFFDSRTRHAYSSFAPARRTFYAIYFLDFFVADLLPRMGWARSGYHSYDWRHGDCRTANQLRCRWPLGSW